MRKNGIKHKNPLHFINQQAKIKGMANMSYCRFENTYADLLDCYYALRDGDNLSGSEREYAKKLIALATTIAEEIEEID